MTINGFYKEQVAAGYTLGRRIKWRATSTTENRGAREWIHIREPGLLRVEKSIKSKAFYLHLGPCCGRRNHEIRDVSKAATFTAYKATFSMHQLEAPTFLILGGFSSIRFKCFGRRKIPHRTEGPQAISKVTKQQSTTEIWSHSRRPEHMVGV